MKNGAFKWTDWAYNKIKDPNFSNLVAEHKWMLGLTGGPFSPWIGHLHETQLTMSCCFFFTEFMQMMKLRGMDLRGVSVLSFLSPSVCPPGSHEVQSCTFRTVSCSYLVWDSFICSSWIDSGKKCCFAGAVHSHWVWQRRGVAENTVGPCIGHPGVSIPDNQIPGVPLQGMLGVKATSGLSPLPIAWSGVDWLRCHFVGSNWKWTVQKHVFSFIRCPPGGEVFELSAFWLEQDQNSWYFPLMSLTVQLPSHHLLFKLLGHCVMGICHNLPGITICLAAQSQLKMQQWALGWIALESPPYQPYLTASWQIASHNTMFSQDYWRQSFLHVLPSRTEWRSCRSEEKLLGRCQIWSDLRRKNLWQKFVQHILLFPCHSKTMRRADTFRFVCSCGIEGCCCGFLSFAERRCRILVTGSEIVACQEIVLRPMTLCKHLKLRDVRMTLHLCPFHCNYVIYVIGHLTCREEYIEQQAVASSVRTTGCNVPQWTPTPMDEDPPDERPPWMTPPPRCDVWKRIYESSAGLIASLSAPPWGASCKGTFFFANHSSNTGLPNRHFYSCPWLICWFNVRSCTRAISKKKKIIKNILIRF